MTSAKKSTASAEAAIVFGPNSAQNLEAYIDRKDRGIHSVLYSGTHVRDLNVPWQEFAKCTLAFIHTAPLPVKRRLTEEDMNEWVSKVAGDMTFESNKPVAVVAPGDEPNEAHLVLMWLKPVHSEVCLQVARQLEKKYIELGGVFENEEQKEIAYRIPPTQAAQPGLQPTIKESTCDTCGGNLNTSNKHILTPSEMRIIAGNGYGKNLSLWGDIPSAERESRFYQLAITNETDWALCSSCYQMAREYAIDQGQGLSHDDFRELVMKPFWQKAAGLPPTVPAKAELSTIPAPLPPPIHDWPQAAPVAKPPSPAPIIDNKRKEKRSRVALIAIVVVVITAALLGWMYFRARPSQQEAQAAFDQGLSYLKSGNATEAAAMFEKAVSLRGDFAEAYAQLAKAYQKLNRNDDAVKAAKRVVELKPNEAWAHRDLGELYRAIAVQAGRTPAAKTWCGQAVPEYKRATELKSDYAIAYNEMGFCYRKLEDKDKAIEAYKEAVRLKPDFSPAHYGLGLAYLDKDDFPSADAEAETLKTLGRPDLAKNLKKFTRTGKPVETPAEEASSP